jgi:hypothetical protein
MFGKAKNLIDFSQTNSFFSLSCTKIACLKKNKKLFSTGIDAPCLLKNAFLCGLNLCFYSTSCTMPAIFPSLLFKMPLRFVCLLALPFAIAACEADRPDRPDWLLKPQKFISITADLMVAESAANQRYEPGESRYTRFLKFRQNIFRHHQIDSTIYRLNYDYYTAEIRRAENVFVYLVDTLEARAAANKLMSFE